MLDTSNTNVLGEFELNASTLQQIIKSGKPGAVTINGEVQAVVVDAHSYQELLEKASYAETVKEIRQGAQEINDGFGVPLKEAMEDIANQKGQPLQF